MKSFSDFHLPAPLADSLNKLGFTQPTPIQSQAIPFALDGRDILGSAQTGTGKTGAFLIPVLTRLMNDPDAQALVMTPTRELATQVMDAARQMIGPQGGIRIALLIGGEPMPKQFKQLDARPRLIIGTPGRIDDHCRRKRSLLEKTSFLVLDEADRMLDMGFSVQIDSILKYMPAERQTLLFSATFAQPILKFAQRYLNDPVRVEIKTEKIAADRIKHDIIHTTTDRKFEQLQSELISRNGSVIIFVKTRRNADALAQRLSYIEDYDLQAEPIHGDLRQRQRDRTIKDFRSEKFRILVATDVASRGLDIPHIEHVINYDLPQNPEDYVHRIGRTARAGAEGQAICLLTPQDIRNWSVIQRLVFPHMAPLARPASSNSNERSRGGQNRPNKGFKPQKREWNNEQGSGFKPKKKEWSNNGQRSEFPPKKKEWNNEQRSEFPPKKKEWNNEQRSEFKPKKKEWSNNGQRSEFPPKKKEWNNEQGSGFKPRANDRSEQGPRPFKKRERSEVDGNRFEHNEGRADNPKRDNFNFQRPGQSADGQKRPFGDKPAWKKKPKGDWKGGDKPHFAGDKKKKGPQSGKPHFAGDRKKKHAA